MMQISDLQIRYLVRIEVWDNEAEEHLVDEAFNTSDIRGAVDACKRAILDLVSEARSAGVVEE